MQRLPSESVKWQSESVTAIARSGAHHLYYLSPPFYLAGWG